MQQPPLSPLKRGTSWGGRGKAREVLLLSLYIVFHHLMHFFSEKFAKIGIINCLFYVFFGGGWEVVCLWFCLCPTPSISFSFNGHLIASLSKQPILHKVSWAIGALLMVATGQTWATLTRGRTESHLTYL